MISPTPATFAGTMFMSTEEGYPVKGRDFLSEDRTVRLTVKPAVLTLLFMISADIHQRFSHNGKKRIVHLLIGLLKLFFRYLYIPGVDMSAVKLSRIFIKRAVFFLFYPFKNL